MYVQETGQAGRDGLMSCALLFYGKGDLGKCTLLNSHEGIVIIPNRSAERAYSFQTSMVMKVLHVVDAVAVIYA